MVLQKRIIQARFLEICDLLQGRKVFSFIKRFTKTIDYYSKIPYTVDEYDVFD